LILTTRSSRPWSASSKALPSRIERNGFLSKLQPRAARWWRCAAVRPR
jgi:hypothetical protein